MKDLSYDDVKDIKPDPSWSRFDYLVAVSSRAKTLLEQEEEEEEKKKKSENIINKNSSIIRKIKIKMSSENPNQETKKPRITFKKPTDPHHFSFSPRDKDFIPHEQVRKKESMFEKSDGDETSRPRDSARKCSKRTRSASDDNGPDPPQPLPEAYKKSIRELNEGKSVSEGKLVIQRRLLETDVRYHHLLIPFTKIIEKFLDEDEEYNLSLHKGKKLEFMEVPLIDPKHKCWKVNLKRWDKIMKASQKNSYYVLDKTWKNIAKENDLESEMVVQLWALRVDGRLWFVLVKVPHQDHHQTTGETSSTGNIEDRD